MGVKGEVRIQRSSSLCERVGIVELNNVANVCAI